MRTYINQITNNTGIGINQVRVVVTGDVVRICAAHLALHASRLWHGLALALEALEAAPATAAKSPAPVLVPAGLPFMKPTRHWMPRSANG